MTRFLSESDKAYLHFLGEVSAHYAHLRDVTNKLAIFGKRPTTPDCMRVINDNTPDCINSLALVAGEVGYVKPEFVDDDVVDIARGRHPMVEALRSDPFVPNDIFLGGVRIRRVPVLYHTHHAVLQKHARHEIITGPNMVCNPLPQFGLQRTLTMRIFVGRKKLICADDCSNHQ